MSRQPLFLERRSYRLRRMMDAVRVLPLLGLGLWMVPLLWPVAEGSAEAVPVSMQMSAALRYVFGVWLLLIAAAFALWRRTRASDTPQMSGDGVPH